MLYVHGWSDCFYQAHLAEVVESWGYDFLGLDLRRYGRNLVPGQMAGWFVTWPNTMRKLTPRCHCCGPITTR
ncbi:lysophospholipase [Cutibacterium acnes JCM 18909]|nr:lysophospholipase [Cutibacterium acnes JCM 18909]